MKNVLKITIFFLVLYSSLIKAQAQEVDNRVLESCVLGNLPQEIQFNLTENPTPLIGKKIPKNKFIELQRQIDAGLRLLIKKSVFKTNSALNVKDPLLSDLNSEYVAELSFNMAEYAPDVFGATFCGDKETVASFILALSFQYIGRALIEPDGKRVAWLNSNKAELDELGVIITIVAIYLSAKDKNKLDRFIESLEG